MRKLDKIKRILLVDDDDIVNSINSAIIKHAGFAEEILVQTSVAEAIDSLKLAMDENNLPELIFLDVNMPHKNGWDFIDEYEQIPFNVSQPGIIMVTSSINPADAARASRLDTVIDFISKPLSPELLDKVYDDHFS
ncbi:response regulator [Ekhidna sp.]